MKFISPQTLNTNITPLKLLLLTLLFSFPLFSFAQTNTAGTSSLTPYTEGVSTVVSPENPGPGSLVTIDLQSSLVNLETSTIVWSVNGKVIQSGRDSRSFSLRLGAVGSKSVVDIYIKTTTLGTLTKTLTFAPTSVELLYEAASYTPPFYKGKALIPSEGVVTLYALPNFKSNSGATPSSNLVFTWKKDGVVDGTNSGLGKNSYRYVNGRLPEDGPTIEVSVTDPATNLRGYASFAAKAVNPDIVFYENNPLLGVTLNQAIPSNYTLTKQELSLIAYPFFFGTKNRTNQNLTYTWNINNNPVPSSTDDKGLLTVRSPGGKGVANIGLDIENKTRILQTASGIVSVSYGQ
jgi:hypothetical protein